MLALLDVVSRLSRRVWYEAEAHDQHFWPQILTVVPKGALLRFKLGFTTCARFAELTRAQVTTEPKSHLQKGDSYSMILTIR